MFIIWPRGRGHCRHPRGGVAVPEGAEAGHRGDTAGGGGAAEGGYKQVRFFFYFDFFFLLFFYFIFLSSGSVEEGRHQQASFL